MEDTIGSRSDEPEAAKNYNCGAAFPHGRTAAAAPQRRQLSGERALKRCLRLYLAGPDIFLPDAIVIGQRKKVLCRDYGVEGLFPFDDAPLKLGSLRLDRLIYAANRRMIEDADGGIFNLTPFRGPSADVGTVFELGMMAGLRKPVFGYTNVASSLLQRIPDACSDEDVGWRGRAWVHHREFRQR